jgi:hypothetical protein
MLHFTAMTGRAALVLLLLILIGCEDRDRIARLEKQNQEFQESLAKEKSAVTNFNLQGKCAKDAREWFGRNYVRDKDTVLLDFRNHYNKAENKCFISVEWHYNSPSGIANSEEWINEITLWNIYENAKYGSFIEDHFIFLKSTSGNREDVDECYVSGTKCKTIDEFNDLRAKYMNQ